MNNQTIYASAIQNASLYEGCGNRFLIVQLQKLNKNDSQLRKLLCRSGLKAKIDSIMVLTGNPQQFNKQGFHVTMDIFEPRGHDLKNPHLPGCWSTMCGNGVRAVVRFLLDTHQFQCLIKTQSGILPVSVLPQNSFQVSMGQFTTHKKDLSVYVSNFDFQSLLPNIIKTAIVGLNGFPNNKNIINGEPHLVILLNQKNLSLDKLQSIAAKLGPDLTTNKKYFPQDINSNFVSIKTQTKSKIEVSACTFERSVEYVTQACGTGATAIGSWFLRTNPNLQKVLVNMPGGKLTITKNHSTYYMTGPASPINT